MKKEKKIFCVAYLSTTAEVKEILQREKQQFKYIAEYARAHNVVIVKVMHKDQLGQEAVNKHFDYMINLIKKGQIDGIIVSNMLTIAVDEADAYYKVGKVKAAGGTMVTVDEGRLGMYIERGAVW